MTAITRSFILLYLIVICSCGFDPNEFNDIGLEPLEEKYFAFPLMKGDIYLEDLLPPSSQSRVDKSNVPWVLEFKTWWTEAEKENQPALLTGSDILSGELFFLTPETTLPELFTQIDHTVEYLVPITVSNQLFEVNEVHVKEGHFTITIKNNNAANSRFRLELLHINSGDTTVQNFTSSLFTADETKDVTLNFNNNAINNSGDTSTQLRLSNRSANTSEIISFQIPDPTSIDYTIDVISHINFTPVVDINLKLPVPKQVLPIDIFDTTLEEGEVVLSAFEYQLITYSTFGIDVLAGNIETYAVSSIDSTEHPLEFSKTTIGRSSTHGEEFIDTLFTQQKVGIFNKKPNKISIQGQMSFEMNRGEIYFIDENSYLKTNSFFRVPFLLGLKDVAFSEIIVFDEQYQESISFLDSAILSLEFENHFPMDGYLSIYTLDDTVDYTPYQIDISQESGNNTLNFMKAPSLDSISVNNTGGHVKTKIRITGEDAQKIISSNFVEIKGTFSTPDFQVVPFFPEQKINISAGLSATVKIDPNEF
ncbi:hypothetical protein [Flammeovirga sp. SubArs3]|uniref:hypothetical protein n=1 Tax=Flammeovirga sp. SubArs3 TaxID=2995316 RepID=UPI00248B87B3|nr:hypothetical protein [Flammeovirga sp. SubArs3]